MNTRQSINSTRLVASVVDPIRKSCCRKRFIHHCRPVWSQPCDGVRLTGSPAEDWIQCICLFAQFTIDPDRTGGQQQMSMEISIISCDGGCMQCTVDCDRKVIRDVPREFECKHSTLVGTDFIWQSDNYLAGCHRIFPPVMLFDLVPETGSIHNVYATGQHQPSPDDPTSAAVVEQLAGALVADRDRSPVSHGGRRTSTMRTGNGRFCREVVDRHDSSGRLGQRVSGRSPDRTCSQNTLSAPFGDKSSATPIQEPIAIWAK